MGDAVLIVLDIHDEERRNNLRNLRIQRRRLRVFIKSLLIR